MRTFDQRRVERDHVEQGTETKPLFENLPADSERRNADCRIEKKFHRIVSRFAMDVDRSGKIGRAAIVKPVVISEPGMRIRDGDKVARSRMRDSVANLFDPWSLLQQRAYLREACAVVQVDMSDLMICDGECCAGARIQELEAQVFTDSGQTILTENTIRMDRGIDRRDCIFGKHNHPRAFGLEVFDQFAADLIDHTEV